jgi:hypothetical protein
VTVSFSEETAPTVTIPEVTLCLGSSTTLSPQVLPVGDYDYLWSPATGLDNPNVANPTVIGSAVGTFTYSLQVVDNNTGCSTTAEAKVNVIGADVLELISYLVSQWKWKFLSFCFGFNHYLHIRRF